MKNFIYVIALLTFFLAGNQAFAQTIKAEDASVKVDKVERPAISVSCETEAGAFADAFASYMKKNYKVKSKTSKDAVTAEAITVPEISSSTFDLSATFKEKSGVTEMLVTGAAGYDLFFSPKEHSDDYNRLKNIVQEFARTYMAEKFDEMIKDQQKEIDASVKEKEKLDKEIEKLQKDIVDANETIAKLQQQITDNTATIKKDTEALPAVNEAIEKKNSLLKELQTKKTNATGK